MIAVTVWKRPMPPSTSDRRLRPAPAIEAANAPLASTNAARIRNEPSVAIGVGLVQRARGQAARGYLTAGPAGGAASYFEGHLAVTPPGSTWNPSGVRRPVSTTSAPSLNVSGTSPV